MRFREIINEISDRVKQATRDRWQQEDENLTDQQINYYLDRWDRFAKSFPADKRDITRLSFADAEKLLDAAEARQALRGKKKSKTTAQTNGAMPGHIYNKNNLIIYKGDSKPKCIQYGSDYTWCISRSDSSNLYNRYRFSGQEPVFYFVFDKDLPKNNPWHAAVIYVTRDNRYMVATADNPGDQEMTWQQISQKQPKLSQLQNLFKPEPPSAEEKADYQKYGKQVDSETYDNFSYQEKIKYIEFGNPLSSDQEAELDSQLLSLYSKQNPYALSVDSLKRLSPGDFRYVLKNAGFYIYTLEGIRQEIESEKKQKIVWEVITQDPERAYKYARRVIEGRFPAGEAAIAQDPEWAYRYALQVIKELEGENRWPAGEAAIARRPHLAYRYADDVIEGGWPEPHRDTAEANIKKNGYLWSTYVNFVKNSDKIDEDISSATDNEYDELTQKNFAHKSQQVVDLANQSKQALQAFYPNGELKTMKSGTGNFVTQWYETPEEIFLIGINTKSRKLLKNDIADVKTFIDMLITAMQSGKTLITSPHKKSLSMLKNVQKIAEKRGLNFSMDVSDSVSFGDDPELEFFQVQAEIN